MLLAVDAGNTRVKWGLHDGHDWLRQGAVENSELAALESIWTDMQQPERVLVSNVAGPEPRALLEKLCAHWPLQVEWIAARKHQCGVACGYVDPAQLGADRWAALVAARYAAQGACVVVNAGTAVTVDALSSNGIFLGGLILPGVALMRRALGLGTVGVQVGVGQFAPFPANTADAVHSGALQGIVGAVERMLGEMERIGEKPCALLLGGGNAAELAGQLNRPCRVMDNLVLEGVLIIAQEGAAA